MLDEGSNLVRRKPVRRTPGERGAIVAETYEPGATVAGVARRHGMSATRLSTWRTAAKRTAERDKGSGFAFAELSVMADALPAPFDGIEIISGPVSIRLPKTTPPKRIADIAHRLAQGA